MRCSHRIVQDSGTIERAIKPGQGQPHSIKQFVRDWLKANPDNDLLLPDEVVTKTVDKYKRSI